MTRIYVMIVVLASFTLRAQDHANNSAKQSSGDPQAIPLTIDDLISHGFSFDDRERPMCEVRGSEGTCHVEAFVYGEKTPSDEAAHTCTKLDNASYVGQCVHGKLQGLSLVIADGSTKQGREAFVSYFLDGRIAYPALTSYFVGNPNFGVREKSSGYGCVYFGKWDASAKRCGRFAAIYGADLFTESNARKLRDETFDLSHYRAKFLDFIQRESTQTKTGNPTTVISGQQSTKDSANLKPDSGNFNQNRYRNDFFGFSYPLPKEWDKSKISPSSPLPSGAYYLFIGDRDTGHALLNRVTIIADPESNNPAGISMQEYVSAFIRAQIRQFHAEVIREPSSFSSGVRDFYRADYKWVNNGMTIYSSIVCTKRDSYWLDWNIVTPSRQDLDDAVNTLQNISFDDRSAGSR